jgi:hypothetical protein
VLKAPKYAFVKNCTPNCLISEEVPGRITTPSGRFTERLCPRKDRGRQTKIEAHYYSISELTSTANIHGSLKSDLKT